MKNHLSRIIGLVVSLSVLAQFGWGQNTYHKHYEGGTFGFEPWSGIVTQNGEGLQVGNINFSPGLCRTDMYGHVLWSNQYFGTGSWNAATKVFETMDESIIITGGADLFSFEGPHAHVTKLDASGNPLWSINYEGWEPTSLEEDTLGNIYVFGTGEGVGQDPLLIKLNASGDTIWTKLYLGSIYNDDGTAMIRTSDGGFLLAISSDGPGSVVHALKVDVNGQMEWAHEFAPGASYQRIVDIVEVPPGPVWPDGAFFMVGSYGTLGTRNMGFYRISGTGNGAYLGAQGGLADDYAVSILASSDTTFLVGGTTQDTLTDDLNMLIMEVNQNGDTLWTKAFGSPSFNEEMSALRRTPNGGYMLFGRRDSAFTVPHQIRLDGNFNGDCQEAQADIDVFIDAPLIDLNTPSYGTSGGVVLLDTFSMMPDQLTEHVICENPDTTAAITLTYTNPNTFKMYPNPAHDVFQLVFEMMRNETISLKFITMDGRVVRNEKVFVDATGKTPSFPVADFAKGTYLVHAQGDHLMWTEKLIIQE